MAFFSSSLIRQMYLDSAVLWRFDLNYFSLCRIVDDEIFHMNLFIVFERMMVCQMSMGFLIYHIHVVLVNAKKNFRQFGYLRSPSPLKVYVNYIIYYLCKVFFFFFYSGQVDKIIMHKHDMTNWSLPIYALHMKCRAKQCKYLTIYFRWSSFRNG